jgi:hypothetical protein
MPTTVVAAGAAVVQVECHGGVQVDGVAVGGSEEASPLAVKPTGVGSGCGGAGALRTFRVVRVSVLPSWGFRGARRNRSRILRAARRAAFRRAAWPASLRLSCWRTLGRPLGGGGNR